MPSSEERSKYASKPSSPRMKPQPIFLFSRVTEPRISVPSFPLAELQFCLTFCRHPRLSLRLRFSPSATDALLRPPSQASLPEFDSSRADPRKESESPLRATQTFGRTLVLHRRHESCLSPGFDRHARSLPSCVPLLLVSENWGQISLLRQGEWPLGLRTSDRADNQKPRSLPSPRDHSRGYTTPNPPPIALAETAFSASCVILALLPEAGRTLMAVGTVAPVAKKMA